MSFLFGGADKVKVAAAKAKAKVTHYRPGKLPETMVSGSQRRSSRWDSASDNGLVSMPDCSNLPVGHPPSVSVDQPFEGVVLSMNNVQETSMSSDNDDCGVVLSVGNPSIKSETGYVSVAPVMEAADESEEEDDEEIARRREAMRARALAKRKQEESVIDVTQHQSNTSDIFTTTIKNEGQLPNSPLPASPAASDSQSQGHSSESESESENHERYDIYHGPKLEKPVFIPRSQRVSDGQSMMEAEEQQLDQVRSKRLEERKEEAHQMVEMAIRFDQNKGSDGDSDTEIPDDTDDPNDMEEYEAWKLRELRRVFREKSAETGREREKTETLQRRSMTDEQLMKINRQMASDKGLPDPSLKSKSKMMFGQRYYHRGAFFVEKVKVGDQTHYEGAEIYNRDFSGQAEGDVDRASLPKVLQTKAPGFRGQTKYTHLVDQDTSRVDNPMSRPDARVQQAIDERRGGVEKKYHRR